MIRGPIKTLKKSKGHKEQNQLACLWILEDHDPFRWRMDGWMEDGDGKSCAWELREKESLGIARASGDGGRLLVDSC